MTGGKIMNKNFDKIFSLMQASFQEEEFRDYEGQKKLLDNPKYSITARFFGSEDLVGFISFWLLDGFNFIEHFAVSPSQRGQGTGSKMLKEFIKNSNKPVVLEVELPENEMAERRIRFYERNGFLLNTFEYYQKPLRPECSEVKLYLMSYPKKLSNKEFEHVKNEIYNNVYKLV